MWDDADADLVIWSDACLVGLGFCYASQGFVYRIRPSPVPVDIFFLELVAAHVVCLWIVCTDSDTRSTAILSHGNRNVPTRLPQ